MSAAFNVRKPFPVPQRRGLMFSRTDGNFQQPEVSAMRQGPAKLKRHHKMAENNKQRGNSFNSHERPAKKAKSFHDPLFGRVESSANENFRSFEHPERRKSRENEEKQEKQKKHDKPQRREDEERMKRRAQLMSRSGESDDSSAAEDSSPAAQMGKFQEENQEEQQNQQDDEKQEESPDDEDSDDSDAPSEVENSSSAPKRSRSAPQELSAKIPVSRHQQIIQAKTYKPIDPRFSSVSGSYNEGIFRSSYKFLDSYKAEELAALKKNMKKFKQNNQMEKVKEIQQILAQQTQEVQLQARKDRERQILSKWKKQEKKLESTGKKPFFLKKSAVAAMKLTANFLELKDSGKLEAKLEKKRKQNQSKDIRFMPRQGEKRE